MHILQEEFLEDYLVVILYQKKDLAEFKQRQNTNFCSLQYHEKVFSNCRNFGGRHKVFLEIVCKFPINNKDSRVYLEMY